VFGVGSVAIALALLSGMMRYSFAADYDQS